MEVKALLEGVCAAAADGRFRGKADFGRSSAPAHLLSSRPNWTDGRQYSP